LTDLQAPDRHPRSPQSRTQSPPAIRGIGLGLRRAYLDDLLSNVPAEIDFLEVAPENWINVGGRLGRKFSAVAATVPLVCHGLSLNLGGGAPLDSELLFRIRHFLEVHQVHSYSEHLSFCADSGQLYELLPIPFTTDAVHSVAARIRRTQELLERRIAIENISYYCATGSELSELEFINAVMQEADCDLLLDINNVYVNGYNHGYDPLIFLQGLTPKDIVYGHIAGHTDTEADLKLDSHGEPVIDVVWDLLDQAYSLFGVFPTVLERDTNFPELPELLAECRRLAMIQAKYNLIPSKS
jgi:uncharacterized protein